MATTSSTVKPKPMDGFWLMYATIRARSRARSPASGRPSSSTRPAAGRATPESTRISVVLPAPLGPTTPTKPPARECGR